jgi:hypothetical protein
MNTTIQARPGAASGRTADWQPRPALREAMQRIATIAVDDTTAVISDRSITFQNFAEQTTISAEPMNVATIDGFEISETITIRTPLTSFKFFDEEHYSSFNIFATTGAIVRDSDGNDVVFSKLTLFEGDDDALAERYTPLIANAAQLQLIGPLCGMYHIREGKEDYDAESVALPGWSEPSYWTSEEFSYAKETLRARGSYANASTVGLTAEFPWEPGAVSAIAGDCTSLLQVRADQPHPSAGNGLFYRLDLPTRFSDDEAREWAARLNRAELEGIDIPPFFGAWCTMPRTGTVSFAGFWPNLLYKPGTVANIAFWSWARSRFAKQVLGDLG